jgi:hypothetical protein
MSALTYTYLQLVADVLADIRISNGYLTDLGTNVSLEPKAQLADEEQRLAVVQAAYAPSQQAGFGRSHRAFGLQVVAQVHRGASDAQQRLHDAQADIDACLTNTELLRTTFQFGAASGKPFPQFESSTIATDVQGVDWVGVALLYTATLRVR